MSTKTPATSLTPRTGALVDYRRIETQRVRRFAADTALREQPDDAGTVGISGLSRVDLRRAAERHGVGVDQELAGVRVALVDHDRALEAAELVPLLEGLTNGYFG